MSVNLLDLLKGQLGQAAMSQLSNYIGASPAATATATDSVFSSLLNGLMGQAATPNGASTIINMLGSGNHDGSIFNNLAGLRGNNDAMGSVVKMGLPLVQYLFGDKLNGITNSVAQSSGISSSACATLIPGPLCARPFWPP